MFWVTDSVRVIDVHHSADHYDSRNMESKGRFDGMNGRSWCCHGMNDYALRARSSVLHRFWRDHISDKNGRSGNIPPYARAPLAVPKATISLAVTVMDRVEGWNEEQSVETKIRWEHVDLHQSLFV